MLGEAVLLENHKAHTALASAMKLWELLRDSIQRVKGSYVGASSPGPPLPQISPFLPKFTYFFLPCLLCLHCLLHPSPHSALLLLFPHLTQSNPTSQSPTVILPLPLTAPHSLTLSSTSLPSSLVLAHTQPLVVPSPRTGFSLLSCSCPCPVCLPRCPASLHCSSCIVLSPALFLLLTDTSTCTVPSTGLSTLSQYCLLSTAYSPCTVPWPITACSCSLSCCLMLCPAIGTKCRHHDSSTSFPFLNVWTKPS